VNQEDLVIIGGGLAGCEAAWQGLKRGMKVLMYEMRPQKTTAAHQTGDLAELVCSNSLKSMSEGSAPAQLKADMASFDSLILRAAHQAKVPAGQALAVDRKEFSGFIQEALFSHDNFRLCHEEVTSLPSFDELEASNRCVIVATGPLTSDGLCRDLEGLSGGAGRLFFYDAIAPILVSDSIDESKCFRADRYGKGEGDDYLNIPLTKFEYEQFIDDILQAEKSPLHAFEQTSYFEACLPVEVMIERGRETLRFGPMKPVGLTDPKTGKWPYAVIQLRLENTQGSMLSMVGFQTKMKWPEQKRVFSSLPALRDVEFYRYGSVHRNTYVEGPKVLNPDLSFKVNPRIFLAGQITGVEGYVESASMGLLAGHTAASKVKGVGFPLPPSTSMLGALLHYVTHGCHGKYAPMNANLGLLPQVIRGKGVSKADKKIKQCQLANRDFQDYRQQLQL
jgi:methylenetetrahydrofolate--tRNA-(uracil-5-)-methyltransferase